MNHVFKTGSSKACAAVLGAACATAVAVRARMSLRSFGHMIFS